MQIETELCHISSDRVIVKIRALHEGKSLGSSLGEGNTLEIAEENALMKLKKRISQPDIINLNEQIINDSKIPKVTSEELFNPTSKVQPNGNTMIKNKSDDSSTIREPEDWSKELIDIDIELKRLCWSKQDEQTYIKELYGYTSRNKITNFIELKVLLMNLKSLKNGSMPKSSIESTDQIISKSNILMNKLNWDSQKGREIISNRFNVSSRNDLTKFQLLEFLMILTENLSDRYTKTKGS
tara:strand:- start:29 stop:748 length:720 start_codon:yes stop_codon:yes gene_type:complete